MIVLDQATGLYPQDTPPFDTVCKDKNSCDATDSDRFRRVSAAYEKCCAYLKEAGVHFFRGEATYGCFQK